MRMIYIIFLFQQCVRPLKFWHVFGTQTTVFTSTLKTFIAVDIIVVCVHAVGRASVVIKFK